MCRASVKTTKRPLRCFWKLASSRKQLNASKGLNNTTGLQVSIRSGETVALILILGRTLEESRAAHKSGNVLRKRGPLLQRLRMLPHGERVRTSGRGPASWQWIWQSHYIHHRVWSTFFKTLVYHTNLNPPATETLFSQAPCTGIQDCATFCLGKVDYRQSCAQKRLTCSGQMSTRKPCSKNLKCLTSCVHSTRQRNDTVTFLSYAFLLVIWLRRLTQLLLTVWTASATRILKSSLTMLWLNPSLYAEVLLLNISITSLHSPIRSLNNLSDPGFFWKRRSHYPF